MTNDISLDTSTTSSNKNRGLSLFLLIICLILLYQSMKRQKDAKSGGITNDDIIVADTITSLTLSEEQKRQMILSVIDVYEVDGEYFVRCNADDVRVYFRLAGDRYRVQDGRRLLELSKDGVVTIYYESEHVRFELDFDVNDLINYFLQTGSVMSVLVAAPVIRRVS